MTVNAARVLFVEDEPKVAASVKSWLEEKGFQVDTAPDGAVGRHLAQSAVYDIILLDLNLPFINGQELCKEIRDTNPKVPIIFVTAMGSVEQKISGFDSGADDYLVKPFDFRELLARMKNLLRRNSATVSTTDEQDDPELLRIADLEIDPEMKTVHRSRIPIELTAKEFALLEFLVRQKGKVVSRHDIIAAVWDINFDTGTNVVDVYINFLRKKIDRNFEQKLIQTKPGSGYFIKE